jgi:hypothetical protein
VNISFNSTLPLKVVSVSMALVLYLFVMQDQEGEATFPISVMVESQPDGYLLLSDVPELSVVITGRSRHLARLNDGRLSELVLRFNTPVTHHRFEHSDFNLPPGLEIRSITPEMVSLNFAPKVSKEVPILLDTRGASPPEYTLHTRLSPDTVYVEGPSIIIDTIEGIFTAPFDVGGIREDQLPRPVGLMQMGPHLQYDRDLRVMVTVEVDINETEVFLTDIPIQISGPADRFSIDHELLEITLRGAEATINGLDTSQIRATVDATPFLDAPIGTYDVAPRLLNIPPELSIQNMNFRTLGLTVLESATRIPFQCNIIPFPYLLPVPIPGIPIEILPPG